jgi:hypothetical protein
VSAIPGESGAGLPLSIIESDLIVVAGAGVSQAKKAIQASSTSKIKLFIK